MGCVTGGDVTSIDQALTTSDPDNNAGPSSRSIKSSSEPSAGGETAPHPANKDKSSEKKPESGVGRVSSFSGSYTVSYDLMMSLGMAGQGISGMRTFLLFSIDVEPFSCSVVRRD